MASNLKKYIVTDWNGKEHTVTATGPGSAFAMVYERERDRRRAKNPNYWRNFITEVLLGAPCTARLAPVMIEVSFEDLYLGVVRESGTYFSKRSSASASDYAEEVDARTRLREAVRQKKLELEC